MTFFKKLLVSLDDSMPSQYAIDASLRIARADGSAILFAVVLDPCLLSEDCSFGPVRELAEQTADKIIGDARKRAEQLGIAASTQLFFDDPVHGIIALAASEDVGMIVMGTHARTGITRALIRSIAESVLRQTTTPLCIVRRQPIGDRHRRLLVPVVDDDLSTFAIEYTTHVAQSIGSSVLFCTIDSAPTAQTQQYLDSAKKHASDAGVPSESVIVPHDRHISACILEQARIEECDAIVMASHGRDGLLRLMEGSVAETVIRSSDIPVVVLRPGTGATSR
jgi:nucleotide-binding universal stress UspA family protein